MSSGRVRALRADAAPDSGTTPTTAELQLALVTGAETDATHRRALALCVSMLARHVREPQPAEKRESFKKG